MGGGPDNPPDLVLIGQYTIVNPVPNAFVFGQMFVNGIHTNAQGVVEEFTKVGVFSTELPAPGALALLGVAGLIGTRRRRR